MYKNKHSDNIEIRSITKYCCCILFNKTLNDYY